VRCEVSCPVVTAWWAVPPQPPEDVPGRFDETAERGARPVEKISVLDVAGKAGGDVEKGALVRLCAQIVMPPSIWNTEPVT
jgi:hypothetical protein